MKVESAEGRDMRRKLAVILASDVAGYSRLVAADEEDTVRRFRAAATAFFERVQKWRGRGVHTPRDAVLAGVGRASRATPCALHIPDAQKTPNAPTRTPRKPPFPPIIAIRGGPV